MTKEEKEKIALRNIEVSQGNAFSSVELVNKILLTVSTGSFLVSMTFMANIDEAVIFPNLIIQSWICFIAAIIALTAVHVTGVFQSNHIISLINEHRENGFPSTWNLDRLKHPTDKKGPRLRAFSTMLSMFGMISVAFGLFYMVSFAAINTTAQSATKQLKTDREELERKVQIEWTKEMTEYLRSHK